MRFLYLVGVYLVEMMNKRMNPFNGNGGHEAFIHDDSVVFYFWMRGVIYEYERTLRRAWRIV